MRDHVLGKSCDRDTGVADEAQSWKSTPRKFSAADINISSVDQAMAESKTHGHWESMLGLCVSLQC